MIYVKCTMSNDGKEQNIEVNELKEYQVIDMFGETILIADGETTVCNTALPTNDCEGRYCVVVSDKLPKERLIKKCVMKVNNSITRDKKR